MQIEIFDFISSKFHPCTIHQLYPSVPASSSPQTCIWRTLHEYPSSPLTNTLHKHRCCHCFSNRCNWASKAHSEFSHRLSWSACTSAHAPATSTALLGTI